MITVRTERPEDKAEIQNVEKAAAATLRQTYRPNQRAIDNKARISADLRRFVAVSDGRIVGVVQYRFDGQIVNVTGLGVHTEHRRKGVARSLIRHLEQIGMREGATRLKLHTVKETRNVEVFKRLGFTVVAEREDDLFESERVEVLIDVEMIRQLNRLEIS